MTFADLIAFMNQKFEGKKTYTTAIVTILSALLAYFGGELTMFETLQLVIPAVLGASIRHGLKTETETATAAALISAEIASGKTLDQIIEEVETSEKN